MPGSSYPTLTRVTTEMYNAKLETVDLGDVVAAVDGLNAPSVPGTHLIAVTGAGDKSIILTGQERVIRAWIVKEGAGGAGDTVQLFNGADAITEALSLTLADGAVANFVTITPARATIAAAGTLKATAANAATCTCTVFVEVLKTA